ncbi:MAG: GtrA family protein [Treponema sp.]|nr:GtrA family protein [Treponema sp.]
MEENKSKKGEIKRVILFTLFSVSAGIIEIAAFSIMELTGKFPYWISYLTALVLSVIWNFTLNRNFTFQSANNIPVAMLKVATFYAVFTPVSTLLGNYLAETLLWNGFLVTALNMAANFVLEYLYDRFFVFGKSIDTNNRAKKNLTEE